MIHHLKMAFVGLGCTLFILITLASETWAFTIIETKNVREGPYAFKMELQVYGKGNLKKGPVRMTSLKLKIKNERASPIHLKVKSIEAYTGPNIHNDIETLGYAVHPGQWVTKYYRLRKEKQPILSDKGYIEIHFENFAIQFDLRERKFRGPLK